MHEEDKNITTEVSSDPVDLTDEEFSLESILAEFKGSAYIDGDKRTPRDILEERTRRILNEANNGGLGENEIYMGEEKSDDFFADIREPEPDLEKPVDNSKEEVTPVSEVQVTHQSEPELRPKPRDTRDQDREDVKIYRPSRRTAPSASNLYINAGYDSGSKHFTDENYSDSRDVFDEAAEAAAVGSFVDEVLNNGTDESDKPTPDGNELKSQFVDSYSDEASESKAVDTAAEPVQKRSDVETLQDAGVTDEDILFFDSFSYADLQNDEEIKTKNDPGIDDVLNTDDALDSQYVEQNSTRKIIDFSKHAHADDFDHEYDEELDTVSSRFGMRVKRLLAALSKSKLIIDELDDNDEPDPDEPDYSVMSRELNERSRKLTLRADIALAVSLVMAVMTVLYSKTGSLFGFCEDIREFTALMIILQLIVMLLGLNILIRGVMSFAKGGPGAEALIAVACLVSYISAFHYIRRSDIVSGIPFCAIPAFSVAFAVWADKLQLRAMSDALKTAVSTSYPRGVMTGYSGEIDRVLVKKYPEYTKGFYNNLVQADCSEIAYRYFAPLLIFASLFLSVITSIGGGRGQYFWYFFSALTAAAAAFSSLIAFSFPFFRVTRRVRKSGAAIAGWSGADAIYFSDGVRVTDDDLFPDGTLSLSGVKIFEDVRPEKAIMYTASLIIASGSGLSGLFSDLLANQKLSTVRIDDFECFEGGVGALIRGEKVIVGSAAFMNLQGIRIPQTLNLKNAVFSAINGTLIAVFAVNYVPVGTVQSALVSLLRSKTKLYFAVRDFNVTPLMLQQKFKVPVSDVEHLPVHDTYAISSENERTVGRAEAVLCREGLGPLAEAVTGAKRLRTWTMISTIVSVVSSIIGLILVFFMCWHGGFASVSPVTLLLYMLAMLAAVLVSGCMASVGK